MQIVSFWILRQEGLRQLRTNGEASQAFTIGQEKVAIGIGGWPVSTVSCYLTRLFSSSRLSPFPAIRHGSISVGTSEVDYDVLVGAHTRGIGSRWALAIIVRCVQHEFAPQPEHYPIGTAAQASRRC